MRESRASEPQRAHSLNAAVVSLISLYVTVMFPILIVLLAARLVMTPAFLQFEYQRAGFPADYYGFTTEDRLYYAAFALNYLLNDKGIAYLGDLEFREGGSLFNARELRHMHDVKQVTQAVFAFGAINAVLTICAAILLARHKQLRRALQQGAILTLSLILVIVVGAIIAWDTFFTSFHNLFFASGTWIFSYSDTLIRLFPEQFWFDAALVIGCIAIFISTLTLGGSWAAARRAA